MRCIIVDDEKSARFIIRQLCKKAGGLEVVEEFSSGIEAIKFLNKNKVDLAFLDIHMPSFNGFDLIELLERPPKVILTTSDSNLALDAFKYDCILDYLVKPIEFRETWVAPALVVITIMTFLKSALRPLLSVNVP